MRLRKQYEGSGWPENVQKPNQSRDGNLSNKRIRAKLTLLARFGRRCFYCERKVNLRTATRDHVVPRSKGGGDEDENIVLCCGRCNTLKDDKLLLDFILERLKSDKRW